MLQDIEVVKQHQQDMIAEIRGYQAERQQSFKNQASRQSILRIILSLFSKGRQAKKRTFRNAAK
ncbi:hypothetical protein AB1K83_15815 [Sporosarcina sp. 179-K 3D1 HS]|uniref:hypothetical protein n=1 Tax=Sporosarcina sp. 179-K 3D1 HS TaxID=3232169 RepID=UPI0039A232CE